jgi:hypothetical protein
MWTSQHSPGKKSGNFHSDRKKTGIMQIEAGLKLLSMMPEIKIDLKN